MVFIVTDFIVHLFFGTSTLLRWRLEEQSGGTLSVAQRDSAVSGYRPRAEEHPAHSATLTGLTLLQQRRQQQGSGGTEPRRNPCFIFSLTDPSGFIVLSTSFLFLRIPLQIYFLQQTRCRHAQLRPPLDDRSLDTSLGKSYFFVCSLFHSASNVALGVLIICNRALFCFSSSVRTSYLIPLVKRDEVTIRVYLSAQQRHKSPTSQAAMIDGEKGKIANS